MPAAEHQMAEEPIKLIPDELERETWKYPGKHVAIADGRIVAVAEFGGDAWLEARRQGYPDPLITFVPREWGIRVL